MASDWNGKKRKLFEPNFPHFFKIVLQHSVDAGTLEFPAKFVSKYENDLGNQISLQVPSGTVWKVDLVKSDDRVYMQNGWREFQQYYSVAHGTLLSFEYRTRSFFKVIIHDLSTTEIVYPYDDDEDDDDNDGGCKEPAYEREYREERTGANEENNPDAIIFDECLPSSSKKRKNSQSPCPRPPKMGRTGEASGSDNQSKLHTSTSDKKCNKVSGVAAQTRILKNSGRTSSSRNERSCFKEVAGHKPRSPSFFIVMKPTYTSGSYMNININFARKYFRQDRGYVTLQTSENRTWTIGYMIYHERRTARFVSGWTAFVQGNNLVPGTKCVFELIDLDKLVLNVQVTTAETSSRKSEKLKHLAHSSIPELQPENSCQDRGKQHLSGIKSKLSNKNLTKTLVADNKNDALSRATTAFKPKNPFFRVIMQPTYIKTMLVVPFLFAKKHFKKNGCAIVLQNVGRRSWNVTCTINNKTRHAYFRIDWTTFVRDNNLKIGDVCTFELTNTSKLIVKVVIVRAAVGSKDGEIESGLNPNSNRVEVKCNPDGKSADMPKREKSDMQSSERLSSSWIKNTVEAAEKFHSVHPYFKAALKSHNLRRNVFVPAKFAKLLKLRPDNVSMLQLQVGEKRWPVKFLYSRKRRIWTLTSGWAEFSQENLLKIGEICAFELVETKSLQVKVTIFRHSD